MKQIPCTMIVCLIAAMLAGSAVTRATMPWVDLISRPKPKADVQISYGGDPLQHVDLWLPKGAEPHPVVLMIHGGCWQTRIADATLMNYIADDLRSVGSSRVDLQACKLEYSIVSPK